MLSRSRREYGAVYSFPFGALLRSDIHVRGGLPSHTVHGSLMLVFAYATVFIIADMGIISYILLFVKYYYEKNVLTRNIKETTTGGTDSIRTGILMPSSTFSFRYIFIITKTNIIITAGMVIYAIFAAALHHA